MGAVRTTVAVVLLLQGFTLGDFAHPSDAATADTFDGTNTTYEAAFSAAGQRMVVVDVPTDGQPLAARVNVTGRPWTAGGSDVPTAPSVGANGTTLWRFAGTGTGGFGHQTVFADDSRSATLVVSGGSSVESLPINLPSGADVTSAVVRLRMVASAPSVIEKPTVHFTGLNDSDSFGKSAAWAGDVNNDTFDDFIVSAWFNDTPVDQAGRAYLFLGGSGLDPVPDLNLSGRGRDDVFGWLVASAGDVSGDGFPDFLVGAVLNDSSGKDSGAAYLYHGGPGMNSNPHLVFYGMAAGDGLSWSLDGLGDVNADGYGDLILGAHFNDASGLDAGAAYIHYGGPGMDTTPDRTLTGRQSGSRFGAVVAGVGDINGDGHNDTVVAAPWEGVNGTETGTAYAYFGGPSLDDIPDLVFHGTDYSGWMGSSVAGIDDADGDGQRDLLIGAPGFGGGSGRVFFYRGGPGIDNVSEAFYDRPMDGLRFGSAVAGIGDLDGDGLEDIVIGTPDRVLSDPNPGRPGRAYVYLTGPGLDTEPDLQYAGLSDKDWYGGTLAGAGDTDGDGIPEILIGAAGDDVAGMNRGRVELHRYGRQPNGPSLAVDGKPVWSAARLRPGASVLINWTDALRAAVANATPGVPDPWGNAFVGIPLEVGATAGITIALEDLAIAYRATATVDLLPALPAAIPATGGPPVPLRLTVSSKSAGRLILDGLSIVIDEPPRVTGQGNFSVAEDTRVPRLVDLRQLFSDDATAPEALRFALVHPETVFPANATITDGHFLSIDAENGTANDNWTGGIDMTMTATDSRNQTTALEVRITLAPVNDAPVFTSVPPEEAVAREELVYQVTSVDAEYDRRKLSVVEGPAGVAVEDNHTVRWTPARTEVGNRSIVLRLDDGNANGTTDQRFIIRVLQPTGNAAPRFLSTPSMTGVVGRRYSYVPAVGDPDDPPTALSFAKVAGPASLTVDALNGSVDWVPTAAGKQEVQLKVTDGIATTVQAFNVSVRSVPPEQNHAPLLRPLGLRKFPVSQETTFTIIADDEDNDQLEFRSTTRPPGAVVQKDGLFTWRPGPDQLGRHQVTIIVDDGLASDSGILLIEVIGESPPPDTVEPAWIVQLLVAGVLAIAAILLVARRRRTIETRWEGVVGAVGAARDWPETGAGPGAGIPTLAQQWAAPAAGPATGPTSGPVPGVAEAGTRGMEAGEAVEPFSIREAFLIYNDGRLVASAEVETEGGADRDLMASMLIAIQGFVRESFQADSGLNTFSYDRFTVVVERSPHLFLAVTVDGTPPEPLREEMQRVLERVEGLYVGVLASWDGDLGPFVDSATHLAPLIALPAQFRFREVEGAVRIRSALEFVGGFVRLQITAVNGTRNPITDGVLQPLFDDRTLRLDRIEPNLRVRGTTVDLGTMRPRETRRVTLFLDPLICQESSLECTLSYHDYLGNLRHVDMKRRPVDIVCPLFYTTEGVNPAILRRLLEAATVRDGRVYRIPVALDPRRAYELARDVVQAHDVRFVRELQGPGPVLWLESWYYGKVRETGEEIVLRATSRNDTRTLEVAVACSNLASLTGLLAELGSMLAKTVKGVGLVRDPETLARLAADGTLLDGPNGQGR